MQQKRNHLFFLTLIFTIAVLGLIVYFTDGKNVEKLIKSKEKKQQIIKPENDSVDVLGEIIGNIIEEGQSDLDSDKETLPEEKPQKKATVTKIIDGDTFEIEGRKKVRLIGIDTPEKGQFYFEEAKKKLSDLILGKNIVLEKDISETDKYKRLLHYAYLDDLFVNLEMIRQGFAHTLTYPPDVKYDILFKEAEVEARNNKRGLWNNN